MTEPSALQQRFWNELTQLRGQIEYLNLYELHCERADRAIKIFLAVAASGSIAAWAVWREFSMLWGSIIAASQFLGAIKDQLPFERRLKCVRDLTGKLESAFVQWESAWTTVANGDLSNSDINSRLAELKRIKVDLFASCLSGVTLPDKPGLHSAASAQTDAYFRIIYSTGSHHDREEQG